MSHFVANNINKSFSGKQVLKDINLEFDNSGMVFIIGKSGSGKTTFLNIISAQMKATSGEVIYAGVSISSMNEKELSNYRASTLGIVYQNYNLDQEQSVYDNLNFALIICGCNDIIENQKMIVSTLEDFSLLELKDKKVKFLSGGEAQRIALIRSILRRPKILLADEPTGNLDSENTEKIFKILSKYAENNLVIIVSHDILASFKYANRIIKMENGAIIEDKKNEPGLSYSVEEYNDKLQKIGEDTDLDKFEVINKIDSGKYYYKISKYPKVKINNENIESNLKKNERISFKNRFKMIFHDIKNNKSRMLFSGIILPIFLCILALVGSLYDFSVGTYVTNIIKNEQITEVDLTLFHNPLGSEGVTLTNGKMVSDKILSIPAQNLHRLKRNNEIEYVFYESSKDEIQLQKDAYEHFESQIIQGKLTIFNTAFLVEELSELGNKVYIPNKMLNEIRTNNKSFVYDVEFFTSNTREKIFQELEISSLEDIESNNLLTGVLPTRKNQVVVSTRFVEMMLGIHPADYTHLTEEETAKILNRFFVSDLQSTIFNNKYDDKLNLGKYLGNTLEIVGIFSVGSDIKFEENIFQLMKTDYFAYFFTDQFRIVTGGKFSKQKLGSFIAKHGFFVDNGKIDNAVAYFILFKQSIRKYIIYAIVVFAFAILIFLIMQIYSNSKNSSYRFGLYRSLGFEKDKLLNDTIIKDLVYLIPNVLIFLIEYALLYWLIRGQMAATGSDANMLYVNVRVLLLTGAYIVIVNTIFSLFIYRNRIKKTEIYDLLKSK